MKLSKLKLIVVLLIGILSILNAENTIVDKNYEAKEIIEMKTISGDCYIEKGDVEEIELHLEYTYDTDCFKPEISEQENKLVISEEFDGSCSGESTWKLVVPENTKLEVASISGNIKISNLKSKKNIGTISGDVVISNCKDSISFEAVSGNIKISMHEGDINAEIISGDMNLSDCKGNIEVSTISGDYKIQNIEGNCEIASVSGDVQIDKLTGNLDVATVSGEIEIKIFEGSINAGSVSGDVDINEIVVTDSCELESAFGDIIMVLVDDLKFDVNMASSSGDVILNYNGNKVIGHFEFWAEKDDGKIVSPIKFDKEEIISISKTEYEVKSFTKENDTPKIKLETSSGSVKLKE